VLPEDGLLGPKHVVGILKYKCILICILASCCTCYIQSIITVQFTNDEIQLLNKGLKYNLHHKNKKWIEILALEAETAITNLDINKQYYYKHIVAKEIEEIKKNNQANNKKTKEEWKK
jgi:hypothetical protein